MASSSVSASTTAAGIKPVLDHVVINTLERLDDASETYQRLGFALTERGHHSLGTSNNLAIFGENYLELLGFLPGRTIARPELVQAETGLHGLVFKTKDADALYDALDIHDLAAERPNAFHRPVAVGGEVREAQFKTLRIRPDRIIDRHHGRVFFCDHGTPDLVWRDEWRAHPNGVTDIVGFDIAAEDPSAAAAPYRLIFGDDAVTPAAHGGVRIVAGRATIDFLTLQTARSLYKHLPGGPVRFVALRLNVRSTDALRQLLQHNGVPFTSSADDGSARTTVAPDQAAGVTLHFVEGNFR